MQRLEDPKGEGIDSATTWVDVASVEVAPRSKRRAILKGVAREKKLGPGTYRVLDAESAREIPVRLKEREPELEIGDAGRA